MNGARGGQPALFTDLYELTMGQAYHERSMNGEAVFDLFVRRLPPQRNYLLACGLEAALDALEAFHFSTQALAYLESLGIFSASFLERLARFRFSGMVEAIPEGTVVFADEPLLQVTAPLLEAQVVETLVLNQVHFETVVASKGTRVVEAAGGKSVVEFGSRRAHGFDAGVRAARALYVAGYTGTSNLQAGERYDIPVVGTMAHSYIQAHVDEMSAFRDFTAVFPETILLVDTYDTLAGVENAISLARELGVEFRVQGIRLDSGDLGALARTARARLDAAGLQQLQIVASGGQDEKRVAALRETPIDVFAVGTSTATAADAPTLDAVYKLSAYNGEGRMKLSATKATLPGRKQVFREEEEGVAVADVIGRSDEHLPGEPLLRTVMRDGHRLESATTGLGAAQDRARRQVGSLPEALRALEPAPTPYPVSISPALEAAATRVRRTLGY